MERPQCVCGTTKRTRRDGSVPRGLVQCCDLESQSGMPTTAHKVRLAALIGFWQWPRLRAGLRPVIVSQVKTGPEG